MKAYIIYIATLLAALALPANGQTGSIDTKAAPDAPAMPYKFSLVTIGGNNGTVTVEDNDPNGNGMTIVGNDTLFYGAPASNNATIVKLTVTPNPGYIIRKDYPKSYKTSDPEAGGTLNGSSPYTFKMPYFPVTVEVAYANQLKEQITREILLKERTGKVEDALAQLPRYIRFSLTSGREDSLQVAATDGWKYEPDRNNGKDYSTGKGTAHTFTYTLAAALPDSIVDAASPLLDTLSGTVTVINLPEELMPDTDDKITITPGPGDNLNNNGTTFNGTIGDGTGTTTVKGLEVKDDVKDATLTLNGITVADNGTAGTTTIRGGADLTLRIEGTNSLGTLTVEGGATVVLSPTAGAKLENTTVDNAGTFRDSTALVTTVTGPGALAINGTLSGGGSVPQGDPVTLTATTTDKAGTTSFIWQQLGADGSYTTITTNRYDENGSALTPLRSTPGSTPAGITDSYHPATSATGAAKYRCLISRETTNAVTLLSTKSETVTVTEVTDPEPTPVYYEITLPQLTGATISPIGGVYTVKENQDFGFDLVLDKEYDQSKPIVTTSRGETLEKDRYYGEYRIINVNANITVTVTGIVKNSTVGNATLDDTSFRTSTSEGTLHVFTREARPLDIYTPAGYRIKRIDLPAGDSNISLPAGLYIISAGDLNRKIVIR